MNLEQKRILLCTKIKAGKILLNSYGKFGIKLSCHCVITKRIITLALQFYTHLETGKMFFSKDDAMRYIKMQNTRGEKPQPTLVNIPDHSEEVPSQVSLFPFLGFYLIHLIN